MRTIHLALFRGPILLSALLALAGCGKREPGNAGDVPPSSVVRSDEKPTVAQYSYEVVHARPHDPTAFTQGLVIYDGEFLESTGLNGESTLRNVKVDTGQVLKKISIPSEYFGEGLTVIGTRAYQVTWRNRKGFIYDASTFRVEGQFSYDGEGWGLTSDGQLLILSDGTDRLRFLDPVTFQVVRTINVTADGRPVSQLNELEWVKGEIFSNVWQTDHVVRIDPSSGVVRGIVNFSGLLSSADRRSDTDVLNGIAYDAAQNKLFITGKRWPKIFEVRLIPGAGAAH